MREGSPPRGGESGAAMFGLTGSPWNSVIGLAVQLPMSCQQGNGLFRSLCIENAMFLEPLGEEMTLEIGCWVSDDNSKPGKMVDSRFGLLISLIQEKGSAYAAWCQ